ncbi:glycosyltransferase family 4 protein [Photobacterium sp. R1]
MSKKTFTARPASRPIWLIADSRTLGGIETHIQELATALKTSRYDVQVILWQDYDQTHPLIARLSAQAAPRTQPVPVFVLDGKLRSLLRLARQMRPLLVHTHGYKAGILCRLLKPFLSCPVVSTYHAGETCRGRLALYDMADRATACLANATFAVSHSIASRLSRPSVVLDNFTNHLSQTASQGHQIAFVGRLSHEKGPDRFAELARQCPALQFDCYGDGPLRTALEQDSPANLHFHGMQQDMTDIWPNIGLLIMPSRHEGLPMAALEALSFGIPVIATEVGAMSRAIIHDHNGWLISPDEPEQLYHWLKHWFALPAEQRMSMRQQAIRSVRENFSAEAVLPALLAQYSLVVNLTPAKLA